MDINDLRELISLGTGRQIGAITESDRLDALGLSSFDVMVITSLAEDRFRVKIDLFALAGQPTVKDLLLAASPRHEE